MVTQQESIAKSKLVHSLTRSLAVSGDEVRQLKAENRHAAKVAKAQAENCASGACQVSSLAATKYAIRAMTSTASRRLHAGSAPTK